MVRFVTEISGCGAQCHCDTRRFDCAGLLNFLRACLRISRVQQRHRQITVKLAPLVLTLATLHAFGDTLELRNGDRLTGSVESLSSGRLTLATKYAGEIKIMWTEVRHLSSSRELEIQFFSGRSLRGTVAPSSNGKLVIHSVSDEAAYPSEIVAIRIPSAQEEEVGILQRWHGTVDVGYTRTRGNSEATQLSFQLQPERRTAKDTIKLDLQALHSVADQTVSASTQSLESRYDRFLSPRGFVFGLGGAERDQREKLNLRTRQGAGFGFRLQPRQHTQLAVFGGSNFLQEDFKGKPLILAGEGLAGIEIRTHMIRPAQIAMKSQMLPNLTTPGRYRFEWDTSIRVPLAGVFNMGLRSFYRFDSKPPADVKKADYGLVSTIGLTF